MECINFNTGRYYSENGQRIVACKEEDYIFFIDIDRGISGKFPDEKLSRYSVMSHYDKNHYEGCKDHPILLLEIKRLGWSSFFYSKERLQWLIGK